MGIMFGIYSLHIWKSSPVYFEKEIKSVKDEKTPQEVVCQIVNDTLSKFSFKYICNCSATHGVVVVLVIIIC